MIVTALLSSKMKSLDIKSSALAGVAGGILLLLMVQLFDKINDDDLFQQVSPTAWLIMGFIVGFSVQVAERITGAS